MTTFKNHVDDFARSFRFKPVSLPLNPEQVGLFHYKYQGDREQSRIHLRVDPDQTAILWVNANRVVHLNSTAAFMARLSLEGVEQRAVVRALTHRFHVSKRQASDDFAIFSTQIAELIRPDGACPVHDLDLEIRAPFSVQPSAPYRMDLALTYRCNNECAHCYNARSRQYPEISTAHWKRIIDLLWEIGIPHVVFTGGEPTLRSDLPELIAYAQERGQITGLNSNGRRLNDPHFLETLVTAGLDHVQITLESHSASIHDGMVSAPGAWKQTVQGIKNSLDSSLYVMTNTTMLQENSPKIRDTLNFIADLGVPTVGLNALIYSGRGKDVGTGLPEEDLEPLLQIAREITEHKQQRLIWYTPTEYCHFDPMQLELGVKGCTAALYNMCIEPNGGVIPCQSYYQSVGNLLVDPWESIWDHPICKSLRSRGSVETKCQSCALLAECGGGCPLRKANSDQN